MYHFYLITPIPYNWHSCQEISHDLTLFIHIRQIGENGCDIIQKLRENPSIQSICILGRIKDPIGIKIILAAIKGTQVKCLQLTGNLICSDGAKYLAEGLTESNISILLLDSRTLHPTGLEYLPDIIKNQCLTELCVSVFKTRDRFFKYLAEGLKNTNIVKLCVSYCGRNIDLLKYLDNILPETNITWLSINSDDHTRLKELNLEDAEYLANFLKDSCITHLKLNYYQLRDNVLGILTRALEDTQIIELDFYIDLKYEPPTELQPATFISKNKILANQIQNAFKKLVIENIENNNFEFVSQNETGYLDFGEYLDLIKTLTNNPKNKGHIIDFVESLGLIPPNRIRNLNKFLKAISDQFNAFFNNNLLIFFDNFNYIDFVKQCEDMGLNDIVKNLLLHRHLYYVDDDQEILHPYIYKMLNKYGMTLFMEQIEPKKKNVIKSYYESHPEIDGAQEIVDLLESHHL